MNSLYGFSHIWCFGAARNGLAPQSEKQEVTACLPNSLFMVNEG